MRAFAKQFIIWSSALLLIWQQTVFAQARFNDTDLDIDPPVIDHEALEVGVAGESQTFAALVIDDKGIEYVDLYYRAIASREYSKASMESAGGSRYIVTIPTELAQSRVEYYIEAADTGGNRVLKGFPFFPLVRNLDTPLPPAPIISSVGNTEASGGGQSKVLYLLLGALAVGLLASAASSSGDDDGGGGGGQQVPLTINISSPAN